MDGVFNQIQGLNLPIVGYACEAEQLFKHFCDKLSNIITIHTPTRSVVKSDFPKRFSGELKKLVINKKTRLLIGFIRFLATLWILNVFVDNGENVRI